MACTGSESRLIDCPANALGSHNCQHSEDAGVRCGTGMIVMSDKEIALHQALPFQHALKVVYVW